MTEGNINQRLRLKNIKGARNYFIKEIDQNEQISKKYKNVCTIRNYIEQFVYLVSAITGYI